MENLKEAWDMVYKRAEELHVSPEKLFGYTVLKKVEEILNGKPN